ncbi:MAG TPA: polyprenyl synthetase family protein [Candidatus Brocadiia bacterium]|nr:polyprenyl synthetase family protein [Candidatus Brocadiales bacterium]
MHNTPKKINLIKLLDEITEVTTNWIRENVLRDDYGKLKPLIEHALTSTTPASDRALMLRLGCELKGEDWLTALPGMASWELLNINLLVTDDFFDKRTTVRMGRKTISQRYGDEACVALGFILKSLASETLISAWNKSARWSLRDAMEVLEWATKWLYYSQFQEDELVKLPLSKCTLEMYIDLIKNATSIGIAGAFELGCIMGGSYKEERSRFRDFGIDLGYVFQIRDDLIDYIYNDSLIQKGPFNDLFTKRRRLPLLVAYWEGTSLEKRQIEGILRKNKLTHKDALVITEMIVSQKVKKRILSISGKIADSAKKKLTGLPTCQPAKYILLDLIELAMDL